jgi:hypothetical protein
VPSGGTRFPANVEALAGLPENFHPAV